MCLFVRVLLEEGPVGLGVHTVALRPPLTVGARIELVYARRVVGEYGSERAVHVHLLEHLATLGKRLLEEHHALHLERVRLRIHLAHLLHIHRLEQLELVQLVLVGVGARLLLLASALGLLGQLGLVLLAELGARRRLGALVVGSASRVARLVVVAFALLQLLPVLDPVARGERELGLELLGLLEVDEVLGVVVLEPALDLLHRLLVQLLGHAGVHGSRLLAETHERQPARLGRLVLAALAAPQVLVPLLVPGAQRLDVLLLELGALGDHVGELVAELVAVVAALERHLEVARLPEALRVAVAAAAARRRATVRRCRSIVSVEWRRRGLHLAVVGDCC